MIKHLKFSGSSFCMINQTLNEKVETTLDNESWTAEKNNF